MRNPGTELQSKPRRLRMSTRGIRATLLTSNSVCVVFPSADISPDLIDCAVANGAKGIVIAAGLVTAT
jgi:L-asparaginase/Glu-tRNA(Gln) amidotransferase subunit D